MLRHVGESVICMRFRVKTLVCFDDFAVRADQHGNPCGAFLVGAFRCPIGQRDRSVGVAQELLFKAHVIGPFFQIRCRAESDSQNDGVFCSIVWGSITEPTGLLGSIIAEGAWIEPN